MNTEEMRDLLQSLPPPMDDPPDRFANVEQRARRRARALSAAVGGAAAVAGIAVVAAVLAISSSSTQRNSQDVATDPSMPSQSVFVEDVEDVPGQRKTIELSAPVTVEATGTTTIELGPRPDTATAADFSLVCLSAGTVTFPDGGSTSCDRPATASEIADPRGVMRGLVELAPAQTSLEFSAEPDMSWKIVVSYVRTETSPLGVNAKGETFGSAGFGASPDLIAVYATNGKLGYAYRKDLDGPMPTSPADALNQQRANKGRASVPVYESDGETVVGEFRNGYSG